MDYKQAGVDVEAGYKSVELMKKHVAKTMRREVLGGIGGFSGAFSLSGFVGMNKPTLISGTDGVGTKLKIAFTLDIHDTVGIDCVAMCVNDIVCAGAMPLFFLDYIACGKNDPEKIANIVKGIANGCECSGAALIGGETAEMPGFYPEDEYDLAGFAVGIVEEDKIITGKNLRVGDALIGIASSGIHSNGFSLIRKIIPMEKESLNEYVTSLGTSLGEALLSPTKIYVNTIKSLLDNNISINACSHITGGGFYENIPRMLVDNVAAKVYKRNISVLPIFDYIQQKGDISEKAMYNTYNMGIGMVIAVPKEQVDRAIELIYDSKEVAYVIGEIVGGDKSLIIE